MTPTPTIELVDATKEYHRHGHIHRALDGATFAVEGPGVHALVGPNGAGKTTVLRALLGLVRLTSGSCRLLGDTPGPGAHQTLARTGALIETPRFPAALSGRRALEIHGHLLDVSRHRIDEALDAVGLADRGTDRTGTYSLGMRQRLGLAVALLGDPLALLLDEPANGLDPPGVRDLRTSLRTIAHGGVMVLLSSHLLGEVEQLCDTVTVLHRGQCVHSGPLAELEATGATSVHTITSPAHTAAVLAAAGWEAHVDDGVVLATDRGAPPGSLARTLVAAGLDLVELRPVARSLDDAFAALVNSSPGDPQPADPWRERS